MNRNIVRIVLLLLLCCAARGLQAQSLKGVWTGGFRKDSAGVRLIIPAYVLNVKEQTNDVFRGRAYVIEQKYGLEGTFDFIGVVRGDVVSIVEVKIVKSRVPVDTLWLCLKTLKMNLSPEKNKMNGSWNGHTEAMNPCIVSAVYLSRYNPSSDNIPPSVLSQLAADPGPSEFNGTRLSDPAVVTVANRSVTISLLDYQRADNDTVTVYLNRQPVVQKLGISTKPYHREIRINRETGMNELIVYANNLGKIPPNTCTMIVDDGVTKQSVNIVTSKQTSAAVYLRYDPPVKGSGN